LQQIAFNSWPDAQSFPADLEQPTLPSQSAPLKGDEVPTNIKTYLTPSMLRERASTTKA
jgi:hypothetical protein